MNIPIRRTAIGLMLFQQGVAVSAPLPEVAAVAAIHPACVADGAGPAAVAAPRLCRFVKAILEDKGHDHVVIVARTDSMLGAPAHLVLGFRLSDVRVGDRAFVGVAAKAGRSDQDGGALYPPPAQILPLVADRVTDADLRHAAATLVRHLGL